MAACFIFDVGLPAEDYFKQGPNDDYDNAVEVAFDGARDDVNRAIKDGKEEIKELLGWKRFRPILDVSVHMVEFDSGNVTHANAIWNVIVKGPAELISQLEAAFNKANN